MSMACCMDGKCAGLAGRRQPDSIGSPLRRGVIGQPFTVEAGLQRLLKLHLSALVLHLRVLRTEETLAVEVNQVVRRIAKPHLRLPSDVL